MRKFQCRKKTLAWMMPLHGSYLTHLPFGKESTGDGVCQTLPSTSCLRDTEGRQEELGTSLGG